MKNLRIVLPALGWLLLLTPQALAATAITVLPTTIKTAGVYILTKSLTYSGTGHAIEVNAPDVTVDFQGYRIEGSGAASGAVGVYVNNVNNVTVEGGTVEGFATALLFYSTGTANSAELIQQMRLLAFNSGIVLDYPAACTIENSAIISGAITPLTAGGVTLNSSAGGNRVIHNFVGGCDIGISTDGYCYLLENYLDTCTTGITMAATDKYRFNVATNTATAYQGGTAITDDNN